MRYATSTSLALVLLAAGFAGEGLAMQNPLYNGINRIVLDCAPAGPSQKDLCGVVAETLQSTMRLPVSRLDSDNPPADNAAGILRVTMEADTGSGGPRYRLIWFNEREIRGGPVKVEGDWIDGQPGETAQGTLAEALVATRPL